MIRKPKRFYGKQGLCCLTKKNKQIYQKTNKGIDYIPFSQLLSQIYNSREQLQIHAYLDYLDVSLFDLGASKRGKYILRSTAHKWQWAQNNGLNTKSLSVTETSNSALVASKLHFKAESAVLPASSSFKRDSTDESVWVSTSKTSRLPVVAVLAEGVEGTEVRLFRTTRRTEARANDTLRGSNQEARRRHSRSGGRSQVRPT